MEIGIIVFTGDIKTDYIIKSRIRDYEDDIKSCIQHHKKYPDIPLSEERIRQDKVIIQELNKILYGEELGILSYQD